MLQNVLLVVPSLETPSDSLLYQRAHARALLGRASIQHVVAGRITCSLRLRSSRRQSCYMYIRQTDKPYLGDPRHQLTPISLYEDGETGDWAYFRRYCRIADMYSVPSVAGDGGPRAIVGLGLGRYWD